MSARPFHKRYHSDALAGFMSLNLEERGAYQTLLDMMYDRGGPLIDNERLLAGYMQCSIRKWRQLRDALISKGKIYITEAGEIANSRVEKELENDAKTTRKLGENGSKGGRTRAENQKKANENSEGEQAQLKPGSSLYQKPEARDQNSPPNPPPKTRAGPSPELAAVMEAGRYVQIPPDHPLLAEWLEAGADLDSQIVPVIRTETEKLIGRTNRGPLKLVVFDAAVRQRIADDQRESERRRRSIEHMRRIEEEQERERAEEARLREQFRPAAVAAASGGRS